MVRTRYSVWPSRRRAAGDVDVLRRQTVGHLVDRQTERGQLALVELDLDLLLEPAGDHHRSHPFDALEGPLDVLLGDESQPARDRPSRRARCA